MSVTAPASRPVLRVRFGETDQMGIAHHSAYVSWMEVGRVEWLRYRGLSYRRLEEEGISLAVSGLHLDYREAARFDDEIAVVTRLTEARSRRFRFEYEIELASDGGRVLAFGVSVHVPTDRSGKAVRLPDPWLLRLREWVEPGL